MRSEVALRIPRFSCLIFIVFVFQSQRRLRAYRLPEVPPEIASQHFEVTIDGQRSPVMHAAQNLYFLNFEAKPKHRVTISISADSDDFWARGVEVQPWRLGIRPRRAGRFITFSIDGPVKLSISRPNDSLGTAEMLYLFANAPEKDSPSQAVSGLQYFGPGVHYQNIDAVNRGAIYLASGAVVFGALNVWGVSNVRVFGRGVVVYDGPQNPVDDDGWMHKKNWHCIVMDEAHNVSIEGITCVVRSRTWQIQMKNSRDILFQNVKVIGGNPGNANADGMDWLGGGDTMIRDSFFRAADDVFALQGSWEGYGAKAFAVEGEPVTNVTIEDSVLSTSISNIVRAGWPEKNLESGHFLMRNTDVLHMGLGGCGIPFALMEIWADPKGRGRSADFSFENIRLEDWYSLTQLMEPIKGISDVRFTDVFGLELPALVSSTLKGSVSGVSFNSVEFAGTAVSSNATASIDLLDGAETPLYKSDGLRAAIVVDHTVIAPGKKVRFEAEVVSGDRAQKQSSSPRAAPIRDQTKNLKYLWSFGDGTYAKGRRVSHRYPDGDGTLVNGDGRFRVLLETTNSAGRHSWAYRPLLVTNASKSAVAAPATDPGLNFRTYTLDHPTLAGMTEGAVVTAQGSAPRLDVVEVRPRSKNYGVSFSGYLTIPVDGAYSFTLLSNDAGRLVLDGQVLGETPQPVAQVCGMAGNAVRQVTGYAALAKGAHTLSVLETHSNGPDGFRLLWRGPSTNVVQEVPSSALSHAVSP